MPTRSENIRTPESAVRSEEWAARPAGAPRSIFGNYPGGGADVVPASSLDTPPGVAAESPRVTPLAALPLQPALNTAMARSFLYRFLALAYEDPTPEGWTEMTACDQLRSFELAVEVLAGDPPALREAAAACRAQFTREAFELFLEPYLSAFGHAARGRCPLNEIEYGDLKADPLFQPHRLADLAAFYRAFGVEVADDGHERHDHLCVELEFMCVLAAKEAFALEHQLDLDDLSLCRDAQKRFLREHLGRWIPAFARRLARMAAGTPLAALANVTRAFIEADCARFGVTSGSEDLLLRPVDEAGESLCHSCGVAQLPPGALPQA
jgi:DMSO reductase family type II enzyme chaperone